MEQLVTKVNKLNKIMQSIKYIDINQLNNLGFYDFINSSDGSTFSYEYNGEIIEGEVIKFECYNKILPDTILQISLWIENSVLDQLNVMLSLDGSGGIDYIKIEDIPDYIAVDSFRFYL